MPRHPIALGLFCLAACSGSVFAQSPAGSNTAEISRRLDVLSKLIDQNPNLIHPLDLTTLVTDAVRATARVAAPDAAVSEMHAAIAEGIVSDKLTLLLEIRRSDASRAAQSLSMLARQIAGDSLKDAIARLEAVDAPQVVVDQFDTAADGTVLPTPPHLDGVARRFKISSFVVGPGTNATSAYPSVASVNYQFEGQGSSTTCTGTLITPSHVLTAAHCFCERAGVDTAAACRTATYVRAGERLPALDPQYYSVFFQDVGARRIRRVSIDPAYHEPTADLAVLELDEPITGIAPARLATLPTALPISMIVGFGQHGSLYATGTPLASNAPASNSQGLKMYAYVRPVPCKGRDAGHGLICWMAVNSIGGQKLGTTCHEDSGGPLFSKVKTAWMLTGVTSIGPRDCNLNGRMPKAEAYVDVNVSSRRKWLATFVGAGTTATDAGTPFLADPARRKYSSDYRVFATPFDSWSDTFTLTGTPSRLSIAVNANPTFSKLSVTAVPPTGGSAPCPKASADAVVVCSLINPKAGKWTFTVTGSQPQEMQVVGSVLP